MPVPRANGQFTRRCRFRPCGLKRGGFRRLSKPPCRTALMPLLSETFRTIHRLRNLSRDLQEEINRGPLQLKARQNVVTKQAKARDDAKETLKKLHVTTRER